VGGGSPLLRANPSGELGWSCSGMLLLNGLRPRRSLLKSLRVAPSEELTAALVRSSLRGARGVRIASWGQRRRGDTTCGRVLVHVVSVCLTCFRCLARMLQVFCMDVAKVDVDISMLRMLIPQRNV
jgi:hypothetical protein